ncbi:hypothetical protein GCM10011316_01800 [Roseibium aquae]|uniref:Cadherin domain-containing protein n=2 Tax=Roseibium aquae TaxID=1323746 RepID=A0A916T6C9_9HYPH|nr:hypothetical protein GCM10011316_01800 [Roseibium aquae]
MGAQSSDLYRSADSNDYKMSVDPGESSEATLANLFQAVPIDAEGIGGVLPDGQAKGDGDSLISDIDLAPDGISGPAGTLPIGTTGVDPTESTEDGDGDAFGGGGGGAPEATGPDLGLDEFDLGGEGVDVASREAGPGIGGGDGTPEPELAGDDPGDDDEGDDGGPVTPNAAIGPVTDANAAANAFAEDAGAGTVVGLTGLAVDPDAGDTVTYTIDDPRFVIDPVTGVVTIAPDAEFDTETEPTVSVTVTATSSDGSFSSQTFSLTVTDVNEDPVGPVSDANPAANTIGEDAAGGTVVGLTGLAVDPDATDTVTYTIDDPRFIIDPETGVVTVAPDAEFDVETEPTVSVTVTATSTDGSISTETFEITITDANEFPIGPVVDENATDNSISEDAVPGTVVGITAFADDPDVSDDVTYSMSGDDRFVIDADTGVITVADGASFDAETESAASVTVTATSDDGSISTETFEIAITDANEFPIGPVVDENATDNSISEDAVPGTVVGITAFADDPDVSDDVTYSMSGDDRFVIDADTGVITVADGASFDAETESAASVTVTATSDDGSISTETFEIAITDANEFPIGPVSDSDASGNVVAENGTGGEYTGVTAFANDPDVTDIVSYALTGGDDRFEIDPDTGRISVKSGVSFDHETETALDVEVTATSSDGSTSTGTFTVNIGDVNEAPDLVVDYGPVGTNLIKNGSFESFDVAPGTWKQFADDSSGAWTSNGKMEIWDNFNGVSATEGDQHLELDSDSNVNSISQTVETSLGQVYDLSFDVQARTNDASNTVEVYWNGELVTSVDPAAGNWQTVELKVVGTGGNDVLEFRETSEDNNTFGAFIDNVELTGTDRIAIVEETPGVEVVPLSVIDPDAGDTHTFTVSDDRFEVVAKDGSYVLKLKDDQALDYETETQVTLQVTATDSGGLSDTETIVIDVLDIIENTEPVGPVSDTDSTRNAVIENASGGTVVGITAFASDADAGDTVTYSITDDRFEIDADTGVLTVAAGADIDRETTPTIDVEVTATSTDGSTSSKTFRIEVGDDTSEFSIGPVSDVDDASNQISETAGGGEDTGLTAFAEDKDATDTVTYELSGDDRFEIDANTGVVTVKDGASFDAETEPTVTVTVTATSTDGSSQTKDFDIEVQDGNEAPDLIVHLEDGSREFIVNGSFEVFEGPLGGKDGTGWYENPTSIEGWAYQDVDVHQQGHLNFGATDGTHHLDLAAKTNGTASQQIDGMLDGQVYALSFDMKSRGGEGQSVAEVYWNGELIDTIDPAKTGSDWQSFSYNLVGGAGDGSDTLTFVEIGSDNNGGALIDSVSIKSDGRIGVVEEFKGAEVAPLSVVDPDAGDTHTFTVSDDRFEVVAKDGKYLLKLKDDQALDYETEPQVSVEVTATDQGGLSDTETIVIDVIDIDDGNPVNEPIGKVSDTDNAANVVMAGAAAGVVVGITAFAKDADAVDTVTYSITDDRFDIDEVTGVVTVADGADLIPGDQIGLQVKATSSDGSSSSKTFKIDVESVNEPVVANDDAATVGLTKTSFYYTDDDGELHLISSDGSDTVIGSTGVGALTDIALDSSGNLYGITFSKLYVVDPDTGKATKISSSSFGTSMNALEFAPDGTLYAASTSGKLYTLDPATGKSTFIGQMDYGSAGDLAFAGGKLYLSASDGSIVEIDPGSGATLAVVAKLPVSNAFGLVGDPAGQIYAFTDGGKVFQIDPDTGTVSRPDDYAMKDSGWGATETTDSLGQTAKVEGNVLSNDLDPEGAMSVTSVSFNDENFAAGTQIQGDYGSLTINSDGSYTYLLDPDSAAAQSLATGASDDEVFTYTVTDSGGNTDTATLTVTVNGFDDGPAVAETQVVPLEDDSSRTSRSGPVRWDNEVDLSGGTKVADKEAGDEYFDDGNTLFGMSSEELSKDDAEDTGLYNNFDDDLGFEQDNEMPGSDDGGESMVAFAAQSGSGGEGSGSWIEMSEPGAGDKSGETGADWSVNPVEDPLDDLGGSGGLSEDSGGFVELAQTGSQDFSDLESAQM